jgi:hypothetical protein
MGWRTVETRTLKGFRRRPKTDTLEERAGERRPFAFFRPQVYGKMWKNDAV